APSRTHQMVCFSALTSQTKGEHILGLIGNGQAGWCIQRQFSYKQIPSNPVAYWFPPSLIGFFTTHPSFLPLGRAVDVGIQTGANLRFLRLTWEVPPHQVIPDYSKPNSRLKNGKWVPLAKGGEYSPWWDDVHLLCLWEADGKEILEHESSRPQN